MVTLFSTIADLQQVIKINASLPWESIRPYINDAEDIYLVKYLGRTLLDSVEPGDTEFINRARRAVGPLAVMLSADEMSISIGDSGITVQNDKERRSPASDAKIAAARASMERRGLAAMSRLISYVLSSSNYTVSDSASMAYRQRMCLVDKLETFEFVVSLGGDYIGYYEMLPLLMQIQQSDVEPSVTSNLLTELIACNGLSLMKATLRESVINYMVNRCAYLYTSKQSRQQRLTDQKGEYRPLLRPLFNDTDDSGSYYREQAERYLSHLNAFLYSHAEELGITVEAPFSFNGQDKKIFYQFG